MSALSANAFEKLLARLDRDPIKAADEYEVLRLKLVSVLKWKGCRETLADSLADTVLDRVAIKLESGEEIHNLKAYSLEVMRFVWLEHLRKVKDEPFDGDELPEIAVHGEFIGEPDIRLICLRVCMNEVVRDDGERRLIIGYYDTDPGEKNKDHRKGLAERFGLSMTSLKVKACRIRARLETCINKCVERSTVTKPGGANTISYGNR